MKISVFKSEEMRDTFRDNYNQILSQFPFEQQYIETTLGKTFMLIAGNMENPPVVLLHGSCSNSAFWFPEIVALSSHYRVYAVDIIGEAGNSAEYRPDLDSDDFALWMKEVLDMLGLEKAILIGNSLGGWMALKFATAFQEHVSKLVLLASAGLAEVHKQFIDDVAQAAADGKTAQVDHTIIGEHDIPKEVLDFMNLIVASYNPIQHLPVYGDADLLRLKMPVLFIDGENDVVIDALTSAQRLKALVPSSEIHLIKNCGHVLTNTIEFIMPFLEKETHSF
jgi:pimeloyl-ACP methyl ester carboxylesterase